MRKLATPRCSNLFLTIALAPNPTQIKEIFADEPVQLVDVAAEAAVTMDGVDLTEPAIEALAESELVFNSVEVRRAAQRRRRSDGML